MKFYKITNEKECHQGLQYHDGLVKDILPFNPYGDCTSGGIYFSSEDILCFLAYGPWLREVTIPKDARVYENPGSPKKWKADQVRLGPRRRIDAQVVMELIEEGADPTADCCRPLVVAAQQGYLEIVELLLAYPSSAGYILNALWAASKHGHLDVVKFLLKDHDPSDKIRRGPSDKIRGVLPVAAMNGHLDVVKFLLPYVDLERDATDALEVASRHGWLEVVKLLLPYSNPKANDSLALQWAAGSGYLEIVKSLLPYSDPHAQHCESVRQAILWDQHEVLEFLLCHIDLEECAYWLIAWAEYLHRPDTADLIRKKVNELGGKPCMDGE